MEQTSNNAKILNFKKEEVPDFTFDSGHSKQNNKNGNNNIIKKSLGSPSSYTAEEMLNDGIETAESTPEKNFFVSSSDIENATNFSLGGLKRTKEKAIFTISKNQKNNSKVSEISKKSCYDYKFIYRNQYIDEYDKRIQNTQRENQKLLFHLYLIENNNKFLIEKATKFIAKNFPYSL